MGCGSSSLKGDAPGGIGGDEPAAPARKVNTNFSSVDYDTGAKARRMTEYAPHETERVKSTGGDDDAAKDPADPLATRDDPNLKPYQTIDDGSATTYPHERVAASSTTPQVNGDNNRDPTSDAAKDSFATANDPANPSNQDSSLQPPADSSGQPEKRRSWLGEKYKKYSDARDGRNKSISDEDMQKYTGKTNEEMQAMVRDGKGVGAGQQANTVGPGSQYVAGGAAGAGIGGVGV